MKKNLYDILEISPEASEQEVKDAAVRLGKQYAAKAVTDGVARQHFNEIKEAYKILSHPYKRAGYDEDLQQKIEEKKQKEVVAEQKEQQRQLRRQQKQQQKEERKRLREARQQQKDAKRQQILAIRHQQQKLVYALANDEVMVYHTQPHWIFYIDIGAVLLILFSIYFLIFNPYDIQNNTPTLAVWFPQWIAGASPRISVWTIGLIALLFIGLMMSVEAFITKKMTEIVITNKRIITKTGIFGRNLIEIKLDRFESIGIYQSPLGRFLDYGTITLTGIGGIKTTIADIIYPLIFKRELWKLVQALPLRKLQVDEFKQNCETYFWF